MSAQSTVYIFGIFDKGLVYSFNPVQLEIKALEMPNNAKINSWCSVLGLDSDEILVTGGLNQTGKVISNEAQIYKPLTQQIIQLSQMNQVRYVHCSIVKDGKYYVLGGRHYGPDFESVLSHCEVYSNGQWKNIAPMSKRRSNFQSFIYHDKIHVIGGFDGRKHTKTIEYYDEHKNVWKKHPMKLTRGLAGIQIHSYSPHELLIIGGISQQGPSASLQLLNLKNHTILTQGQMLEARTLPLFTALDNKLIILGGNNKTGVAELYSLGQMKSEPVEINTSGDSQVVLTLANGLRGFSVSNPTVYVQSFGGAQHYQQDLEAEDTALLFGNDEFPFILGIRRTLDAISHPSPNQYDKAIFPIAVPTQLRLLSYMSSCFIENETHEKLVFLGGGIDFKITNISKQTQIVKVNVQTGQTHIKNTGKLQYHRYASACVYKQPYVYMIGGRGYQNDVLSLHNTVERYNMEEDTWEQIPPLNEAKCSLSAAVLNERIYVFGGYVGEARISNKIECLNEGFLQWTPLNVSLPFSLEGLSAIKYSENEILLIGGKGENGSRKEIVYFSWKELEDDFASNGQDKFLNKLNLKSQIIGEMEHCRALPKALLMKSGELMVFGGQFYDNPEISFSEVLQINDQHAEHVQGKFSLPEALELIQERVGGSELLGMFSLIQN